MAKLVQLTKNSWIIRAGDTASGMLFKQDNGYLYMNARIRQTFDDLAAVEKKFGSLKEIARAEQADTMVINGYPVKHPGFTVVSENPPHYTKGGNTVFAAGYWGLKFPNGWTQAFCPKAATLEAYETTGPFRNRIEMLNNLSLLNNAESMKANDVSK